MAAEELARTPAGSASRRADVEALVDSLADAGRQVISASPARLQELYEQIGLELVYNAKERMVAVTIRPPRRVNACVRVRRARRVGRLDSGAPGRLRE
ncbi:hypothetical protein GCM10009565_33860 [Amycolatopsis albidoflavus]